MNLSPWMMKFVASFLPAKAPPAPPPDLPPTLTVVAKPCQCAGCIVMNLILDAAFSQLARRDFAKRSQQHPPMSRDMIKTRFMNRVQHETKNFHLN